MPKATLKLIAEPQSKPAATSGEISDFIPLKRLASHVLIKSCCDDCNTERTQSASQFMTAGVSPFTTIATLNQTEKCKRASCGGDLRFSIDLGDD